MKEKIELDKTKIMKYMWINNHLYPSAFRTVDNANLHIDFAGEEPNETNETKGDVLTGCEFEIDGRVFEGEVRFFFKLSSWNSFILPDKSKTTNVAAVVVCIVDQSTINSLVSVIECDLDPQLIVQTLERINARGGLCIEALGRMSSFHKSSIMNDLIHERLQVKYKRVISLHSGLANWQHTFTYMLFSYILPKDGVAKGGLIDLVKIIAYDDISKTLETQEEIEALLFGCAGLLGGHPKNEYLSKLKTHFSHLQKTYKLIPMQVRQWQRVNPIKLHNSIATLAAVLHKKINFIALLSNELDLANITKIIKSKSSSYWANHCDFSNAELSTKNSCEMSTLNLNTYIINVIIPCVLAFAENESMIDESLRNRVIALLLKIKAENNHIVRRWRTEKAPLNTAYESQAVIQLETVYCNSNNCLKCPLFQVR